MIDLGRGVKLITRKEWGARPPRSTSPLNPTYGTTAHWEGPHMGWPWDHAACFSLVRGIQRFHMDTRGWADIAYSYVACPHAFVFEGRGIGRRTAANGTTAGNTRAYAVCYLGGQGDPFTEGGKRAMRAIFDHLDAHGGAGPGRNGHRDWKPTECPGGDIYAWVRAGMPVTGPLPPPQEDDMALFKNLAEFDRRVRAAVQAELSTAGDPSRTSLYDLMRRAVADQAGYWGRREGVGEVSLILFNAVRVPVSPAVQEWAARLRAASRQPAQSVVAVPAEAWDDMAVLAASAGA